jgi:hypothetical protein
VTDAADSGLGHGDRLLEIARMSVRDIGDRDAVHA